MKRPRSRSVEAGSSQRWLGHQVYPEQFAESMHSYRNGNGLLDIVQRAIIARRAKIENKEYLERKIGNDGTAFGYRGVSAREAALVVAQGGFRLDSQRRRVFAWDLHGINEAFDDARRRARAVGEEGSGMILELRMGQASPDSRGWLGYTSMARNVSVIDCYPTPLIGVAEPDYIEEPRSYTEVQQ